MVENTAMKTIMVLVSILALVLVLTSLTYLTTKTEQTPEGKSIDVSGQQNTAGNGNASPEREGEVTGSVEGQTAGGSALGRNSKNTDDPVPNQGPVETPNDQNVTNASGNHAASENIPPPDGRVYPGGEEPYAYITTYSPKERLPIAPLSPDE